jgi:hypothetical protein
MERHSDETGQRVACGQNRICGRISDFTRELWIRARSVWLILTSLGVNHFEMSSLELCLIESPLHNENSTKTG